MLMDAPANTVNGVAESIERLRDERPSGDLNERVSVKLGYRDNAVLGRLRQARALVDRNIMRSSERP